METALRHAENYLDRIEEAALNAWPAPRQMLYDGWLLRFAAGYTKRANSIHVRYAGTFPPDEKISRCERVYDRMGLPTLFRLPEPFTGPEVRTALAEAGYETFDRTLVLGRRVDPGYALPTGLRVRRLAKEDWIALRAALTGTQSSDWAIHLEILRVIVAEKALLGLWMGDFPVACGMGVVEPPFLGYFSIFTAEGHRRRGYARALMDALSRWGNERGADFGYLQVEGDNDAALALYDRLGFDFCYAYAYARKG